MDTQTFRVRTGATAGAFDITDRVAAFVRAKGDGLVSVFVPHSTAGIALVETGAGSDQDLLRHLEEMFPRDSRWLHRHGSRGHGADHVTPAFVSPSAVIPVLDGIMALGTWQSVVLVDTNRENRERTVLVTFLAD
ncbi:MAG: secondary thiamine-phosphate synthase enzyme YjbQ [bacterium]|nr:secondary thiamine-phosphate synthase enzyme YjbQ [bacterium]MDE0290165.1 secondary thiamine-phosphate synthase enzyme YjbQ [bacterium]MDE0440006.1 secondary thiamine-phosphate synthase enzyme YjbQ [bacterium]